MDLILAGKKSSTIRLHTTITKGETVYLVSGKHWLKAEITEVQKIAANDLTDSIAKTDGFETADELFETLIKLYPGKKITDVFYLTFTRTN